MSRKYRQSGYQDQSEKREQRKRPEPAKRREGPRSPRMPGLREAVRCAMCGAVIRTDIDEIAFASNCDSCGAALRCCKNCVYFDPASRFECTQPIPERISPKDKRNSCQFFQIRTTVEKIITSSQSRQAPRDARQAFEDLFKK